MLQHPVAGGDDGALLEAQVRPLADSYWWAVRAAVSRSRASAMHDDHEHDAVGSASLIWLSSSPDMFEEFAELVSPFCARLGQRGAVIVCTSATERASASRFLLVAAV